MTEQSARRMLPIYAEEDYVKEYKPREKAKPAADEWKPKKGEVFRERVFEWYHFFSPWGRRMDWLGDKLYRFKKRYGILLIAAALFTVYTIILSACVESSTEKRVWEAAKKEYAAQLEAYKEEQAYQQQAASFLSGTSSLEQAIQRAVDAVAPVIAKLENDSQKKNEVCCMIARHMNPAYPGSFEEIAEQKEQWPLYNGKDKTYTQHDRDVAESLLRPYMSSGIVPNGLTMSMVYGEWTPTDFILRDSFKTTSTMHTWRYQE